MNEIDLQRGIDRREFKVVYQPIVAFESGQIAGLEALVRWKHPQQGLISPAHFIAAAEESGLIVPIGDFVLNESLKELGPLRCSISINLSRRQLLDENVVSSIENALKNAGVAPRLLTLEVPQSAIALYPDAVLPVLGRLRMLGVKLAIDDFRSAGDAEQLIPNIAVDALKIDHALVHAVGDNDEQSAIIETIVDHAHNLDIDVIAEGVETVEQFTLLQAIGLDFGQGYLFSRPVG